MEITREEVEISGHKYNFFTSLPAMKMMTFKYELFKIAKKELYNALLETGGIAPQNQVGYQVISTPLAAEWVFQEGFGCPDIIIFLCKNLAEENKEFPLLDSVMEAGEEGLEKLKLFFIGLILPQSKINAEKSDSEVTSKKSGQEKKAHSPKAHK